MTEINVQSKFTTVTKWKISNFSTVAARNTPKEKLNSDVFQLDSSDIKCCLTFRPTSSDAKDKNYSALYLGVKDFADEPSIKLCYRFWIENQLGDKIRETEEFERIFKKPDHDNWGYSKFINHGQLYSSKNPFFKNNVVFFCASIFREDVLPKPEVNRNLWNSYKEGLTGECILNVSGEELKVSKMLLTAYSEVFKSMLTNSNQESIDVVNIDEFDAKTINALIEYLHKESVDDLSEVAVELFKAANKYGIKGLEAQCVKSLVKSLNKDNLRDRIIFAFEHNSEDLTNGIVKFVKYSKDSFTSIIRSSEWIDFMGQNKELASEIIAGVLEKLNFTD